MIIILWKSKHIAEEYIKNEYIETQNTFRDVLHPLKTRVALRARIYRKKITQVSKLLYTFSFCDKKKS